MQPLLFEKLRDCVSTHRLEVYRLPGDTNFDVICKYIWNKRLSETLYPLLETLEVALRITIHNAAGAYYGIDDWFDPRKGWPLEQRELDAIAEAKSELTTDRKPLNAERIVASLTLGFWSSLMDRRYDRVWPKLIANAFPHMPRSIRTRDRLSVTIQPIRKLRNRVFHHERISHWTNLMHLHTNILETIGWISPEWKKLTAATSKFSRVLSEGVSAVCCELVPYMIDVHDYSI